MDSAVKTLCSDVEDMKKIVQDVVIVDCRERNTFRSKFCGMAYTRDSIIIDQVGFDKYCSARGLPNYCDLDGGRFYAILYHGEALQAFCDPMGQDTLYYYAANKTSSGEFSDWAISNSFIGLVQHLRSTGRALSLNKAALTSFFIKGGTGHGAQLLCHQTPINEIRVLPVGWKLTASQKAHLQVTRRPSVFGGILPGSDYRANIERFVLTTSARLRALSNLEGAAFYCDLSGGRDSRIVAGILMRSGVSPRLIQLVSTKAYSEDYAAALQVAGYLKCKLNSAPGRPAGEWAFSHWAMASAGCYLPLYASGRSAPSNHFHLHGGNFIATKFLRLNVGETAHLIESSVPNPDLSADLTHDFMVFFDEIGVDAKDPSAMQHHYLNMRSRFHYGRNWSTPLGMKRITPLLDRSLADLFLSDEKLRQRFYCDLLLAVDNNLALIPFDDPRKEIKREMLVQSPFLKKPVEHACRLPDPIVYCGKADGVVPVSGKPIMNFFNEMYCRFEESGMDTKLFNKRYRQAARQEVAADDNSHRRRRAAHILTAGILMHTLS